MAIVFEKVRKEYAPIAEEILDTYFPAGMKFNSIDEALAREDRPGHRLSDFLEEDPLIRTADSAGLPVLLQPGKKVDILWKQVEDYGGYRMRLPGVPVLRAKFIEG